MLAALEAGETVSALARRYETSRQTILRAKAGRVSGLTGTERSGDLTMGRPDNIGSASGSLRRKITRARHRRETVPCSVCGQLPTPEGHDACLGTLPGVQAACCGHGKTEGYVMFDSGRIIRGTFDHAPRKTAVTRRNLKIQISDELYAVLERLGAEPELLAIVGSWGDRLGDAEVLSRLRKYNATGREAVRGLQNAEAVYGFASTLTAAPRPCHLHSDDHELVVFCFGKPEDAQAFAERFGGEQLGTFRQGLASIRRRCE